MQYLVYVVAFLASVAQSLVALAMPLLAIHQFGAQNLQLGLLAAGNASVYTVVALTSGRISERVPVRTQLVAALFVLAASYWIMFHAPSYPVLLALNVVNGIMTGLLWAPLEGALSRLSKLGDMRRNVGRYNLSWSAGMAFGFGLFSYVTQIAFYTGAALTLLTALLLLFLRAPHAGARLLPEQVEEANGNGDVHHRFFLVVAWSGLFAAYVGVGAARNLFPKLATELGISGETMGRIYGIGVVAQTVVMALMGRFNAWHYRKEAFVFGEVGMVAAALLIALGRIPAVLAVGHIALGAAMAVLYSCSLYYSMQYSARAHHNTSVHEGVIGTAAAMSVVLGFVADHFQFTPLSFYIAGAVAVGFLSLHLLLFSGERVVRAQAD